MSGIVHSLNSADLSTETFKKFCRLIHQKTGIQIKANQQTHLAVKLRKIIKKLALKSYDAYWRYLENTPAQAADWDDLYDAVSVHETYFQRGIVHYQILSNHALPQIFKNHPEQIVIWSCGTATGEEAYDLSMITTEFKKKNPGPSTDIKIIGTDLSDHALTIAKTGEYADRRINRLSSEQVHTYFDTLQPQQSQLPYAKQVLRVKNFLKKNVTFKKLNLKTDSFLTDVDILFCRNVLFYFDPKTKLEVYQKFIESLKPGGYLFLGHTEALPLQSPSFKLLETDYGSVYQKTGPTN